MKTLSGRFYHCSTDHAAKTVWGRRKHGKVALQNQLSGTGFLCRVTSVFSHRCFQRIFPWKRRSTFSLSRLVSSSSSSGRSVVGGPGAVTMVATWSSQCFTNSALPSCWEDGKISSEGYKMQPEIINVGVAKSPVLYGVCYLLCYLSFCLFCDMSFWCYCGQEKGHLWSWAPGLRSTGWQVSFHPTCHLEHGAGGRSAVATGRMGDF